MLAVFCGKIKVAFVALILFQKIKYRKISIRRTKFQNLNVSRLGLPVYLPYILKPSAKWRMKM